MNERERLLTVLEGGRADQTPWYGDLSWWHAAHTKMGDLPEAYRDEAAGQESYQSHFQLTPTTGEGYLKFHQDVGIGVMFYAPMVWRETFSEEIGFFSRREGNRTVSRIATPVGGVESISGYLPESYTAATKTHYVKNPDDLRVLRYVWEHRQISSAYEVFERTDRLWGEAGVAVSLGPICTSALQTLITRWAGIETTVSLIVEAPEALEETLEALQAADDAIFEVIADSPARVVEFPDNIAGELTGTHLLRKYVLPYWVKRVRQLQAAGKLVGVHNDGGCKAALPVIIEAGFDFVEAVTPAPAGDLTLEEIRDITAGRIVVIGGLPGVFFSPQYTKEHFEGFVRQALSAFPRGRGFVLGVADQVPPDGEFERMCLVRDILENR
jgi:uroporphyrinogen-III decarboxylase